MKKIYSIIAMLLAMLTLSSCTAFWKPAPNIQIELGFLSVDVIVECEVDYKEVNIELCILDDEGTVTERYILRGVDYSRGEKYKLTQSLSISSLTKDRVRCRVKSWK